MWDDGGNDPVLCCFDHPVVSCVVQCLSPGWLGDLDLRMSLYLWLGQSFSEFRRKTQLVVSKAMRLFLEEEHASRFYRPHVVNLSTHLPQCRPVTKRTLHLSAAVPPPSSHPTHRRNARYSRRVSGPRRPCLSHTTQALDMFPSDSLQEAHATPRAHGHLRPRLPAEEERPGRRAACDIEVPPAGWRLFVGVSRGLCLGCTG